MDKRFEGQTVWISGSTKGIGRGAAELFAREGAAVAVIGRGADEGKAVAEKINSEGGKAVFIRCDLTDAQQIKSSIEETVRLFGGLNVLVNNAANILSKMLHETEENEWDAIMNLNLKSIYRSFKYAFEHLTKNEKSYIVNVGSINSFIAGDRVPVYTASKGAVLQLSKSIALDYARYGIRCNCVCPGITHTPLLEYHMSGGNFEEKLKQRVKRVPLGNALSIYEVAKAILYFSCEDSAGITATSLIVDGGMLGAAEWDFEQKQQTNQNKEDF